MKKSKKIIRYILCGALCFGVYHETGIWTSIAFIIVLINIEVTTKYFLTLSDNVLSMKKNYDEPFNVPMTDEEKQKLRIEIDEELLKRKSNPEGIANKIMGEGDE